MVNIYSAGVILSGTALSTKLMFTHLWSLSQDQPLCRGPVPTCPAHGFKPVFSLTVKCGFSQSWSFPGVLLSWEPTEAASLWGRKGLLIKAKESHHCCCSHYNSGLAIFYPTEQSQPEGICLCGLAPTPPVQNAQQIPK
jgi:hypothetical protein